MSPSHKGVRKGQAPPTLSRDEFGRRYLTMFDDPVFEGERVAIARLTEIACGAYVEGRKAPHTQKAGPEFADPDYDLSTEWLSARDRLKKAQKRHDDAATPGRVLVICGSDRNDGTCPGEMSKSFRLSNLIMEILRGEPNFDVDFLDLSLL